MSKHNSTLSGLRTNRREKGEKGKVSTFFLPQLDVSTATSLPEGNVRARCVKSRNEIFGMSVSQILMK